MRVLRVLVLVLVLVFLFVVLFVPLSVGLYGVFESKIAKAGCVLLPLLALPAALVAQNAAAPAAPGSGCLRAAAASARGSSRSGAGAAITGLIAGLVLSLNSASGAFSAAGRALNQVWRVDEGRGLLKRKYGLTGRILISSSERFRGRTAVIFSFVGDRLGGARVYYDTGTIARQLA